MCLCLTSRTLVSSCVVFSTESVIPRSLLDSGLGGSQSTSEEMGEDILGHFS